MKSKFKLFLFILIALVLPFMHFDKAHAVNIKDDGQYALILNAAVGTIDGSSSKMVRFDFEDSESDVSVFDLTKGTMPVPNDKNNMFKGWAKDITGITMYDENSILEKGQFSSYDDNDKVKYFTIYATYEEVNYNITLDSYGGTVNNESSIVITGKLSEFQTVDLNKYTATKEGCVFCGWVYDEEVITSIDKNYLLKNNNQMTVFPLYKSITKKEITSGSASELKGSVLFESPVDGSYRLDIKEVKIPKGLTGENVKFVADISLINDKSEVVEINGIKMKIKMALPKNLKGYSQYEVVYIGGDGKIKETLPATIENGYIVFETNRLSKYGIVAKNILTEEDTDTNISLEQKADENPLTGDAVCLHMVLLSISSVGIGMLSVWNRKKLNKVL